MVVDTVTADRLFHALADATRRDILRRSADGELSVSRLADGYPMSFAAVQKHVVVLERAGLVTKERRGREPPKMAFERVFNKRFLKHKNEVRYYSLLYTYLQAIRSP